MQSDPHHCYSLNTNVYMSFWLDTRVFDVVSCMNLHSTVCQVGDKKKKDKDIYACVRT